MLMLLSAGSSVTLFPTTQVHVLTFTVYQLLSTLSPTLKSGDLDSCMNMLIDVRACFSLPRESETFHCLI